MQEFTKEALDILKKSKQLISDKNIKINTQLVIGNPPDEICKFAKENSYDLIIIGSRGLSGIKSYIMGSVSNRVSRYAHCPALHTWISCS
ncbi:universal stress protein [Peptococcaceae bacterium]|nr:universal stress protein [Peptococcaceae bacterium]